jgi:signal transduction histidine kinase
MAKISLALPPESEEREMRSSIESQGSARLLLTVSQAHRTLAYRQWWIQQFATWFTVLGLIAAEHGAPILKSGQLGTWFLIFLIGWVGRACVFIPFFRLRPEQIARSFWMKLLPLLSTIIFNSFWIWTTILFTGPMLSMRELLLCFGFLSINIAMTGMWPVSPATSLLHYFMLWSSLSINLYLNGSASFASLVVLNVSVIIILWLNIFVSINQVKDQLNRSDEMDALLKSQRESNEQLRLLKDLAHKSLETRSEFFSAASHDFRQRLHAAKLWVLSAMAAAEGADEAKWPLTRLGQEIDALQGYINHVLDFARIESLDAGVQLDSTNVQALFQKLDLQFEQTNMEKGTNLRFRRSRITLNSDFSMLLRILENLVSNALKFTRGGVLVCARRRGEFLAIEVWDQGPGIKPEAHQRIFDAFYQETDGGSVAGNGVGLGLAIVKRFANRLGYQVEIQSAIGKGTVFRVLIPAEAIVKKPLAQAELQAAGTS